MLVVVVPLLALPVLGVVVPELAALPVLGVPLAWWVLAAVVYPVIWLAGRRHVTGAERSEDDYRELVGEPCRDRREQPPQVPGHQG